MRAIHPLVTAFLVAVPGSALAEPAPTSPPTSEGAWQIGVAPRLGLVVPTSKLGAMAVGGVELDYALPAANRRLVAALDLSLTRPSYDGSVTDPRVPGGTAMYTIRELEVVVGATIGYRLASADHALVPWGAIGPVLHLLRTSESSMLSPDDNTAISTELGLELAAGVDYRTGPGFLLVGGRLIYSKLDHALTGDTNAGKLALEAGYRIVF